MSRHARHPGRAALFPRLQSSGSAPLKPEWAEWDVLELRVTGLPESITTYDLWFAFQREGHIDSVDIFVNRQGRRDGTAKIKFKPPPQHDFLGGPQQRRIYAIDLHDQGRVCWASIALYREQKKVYSVKSPVNRNVEYPEFTAIDAETLEFGVLRSQHHMLVLSNRESNEERKVEFSINLRRKQIFIRFKALQGGQMAEFRLCKPFEHLETIRQTSDSASNMYLVINLSIPPQFHRKYRNVEETHKLKSNTWRDENRWYRQTDLEASKQDQQTRGLLPVQLKRAKGVLNLGRWTTYCLKFSQDRIDLPKMELIRNILKDHNIPIPQVDDFKFSYSAHCLIQPVWDLIEPTSSNSEKITQSSFAHELMTNDVHSTYPLSFTVRYALEVAISKNFLNEYTLDEEFLKGLTNLSQEQALNLLEYIMYINETFLYNPLDIFELWRPKFPMPRPKLPKNCCLMRSVTVTPTTLIVNSPTVEVTNRVIRQYEHVADRFLRVRFEDDLFRGLRRLYATDEDVMNEVFSRVMRTLSSGIIVGGQKYEFLAYGNSQLRDHGAYFFASTPTITAANIRAWMGRFDHEKIIAKHAARIGQCFSTTRAIRGSKVDPVRESELIPDIMRNGFNFTDGVGKMSRFLAEMITMELGIRTHSGGAPSLFQFRLSGCKGVLAIVSQDDKSIKWNGVGIRKSQFKFESDHHGLEVIRHSEFCSASLNRQLILVLSALGVEDEVFLTRQEEEIKGLREAMEDDNIAIAKLNEFIDPNHGVMLISHLVADGFRRTNDPFTTSLLRLWRAWSTKDLKERAKLKVKDGAFLLGCIDETATLRGHFNKDQPTQEATYEERVSALPQIFVQVSRMDSPGTMDIINGVCVLARNPSLHPGDMRVVHAIDVPELHHLKDVVVLPQTGDRDLSSMCSGGDLDGDDYIVIWDKSYIPKVWNHEPMDYTPPPPKKVETNVTPFDIMRFFVQYIKNDYLPRIAQAHMAWADFLDEGLTSEKCLDLAALHSKAVDYPKTGQPAAMEPSLYPKSWPHFMQKHTTSYHSEKILGRLYDGVEAVAFTPNYNGRFDERILNAFDTDEVTFDDVQSLKESYDEHLSRIMALHEIKTEFEVFSTLCLGHSQATKDYKFHEQLGRLSSVLKQQFKDECVKRAGGSDYEHLAPYAVAMYKVTKAQFDIVFEECRKEGKEPTAKNMPYISFPWILQSTISELVSKQDRIVLDDEFKELRSRTDPDIEAEPTNDTVPAHNSQQKDSIDEINRLQSLLPTQSAESQGQNIIEDGPTRIEDSAAVSPQACAHSTQSALVRSSPIDRFQEEDLNLLDKGSSVPDIQISEQLVAELALRPGQPAKDVQGEGVGSSVHPVDPLETTQPTASDTATEYAVFDVMNEKLGLPDSIHLQLAGTARSEKSAKEELSSKAASTSRSSVSSQSEGTKSSAGVDSQTPTTNMRRRRRYGTSSTTSDSERTNAEIEALLAQSDLMIQQRHQSRSSSGGNSYSAVEIAEPLTSIRYSEQQSEQVNVALGAGVSRDNENPSVFSIGRSSQSSLGIRTKEQSIDIENRPPSSASVLSSTTMHLRPRNETVTAMPGPKVIKSEDDEAALMADEFVPGPRKGRTAIERLENLVYRH